MIYVQKFELRAVKEAINYYYILRNVMNEEYCMFVTCIIDLALEMNDYEMLFGKIQMNGLRTKGLLDDFVSNDIKIDAIAQAIAEVLISKGLFEDAVSLFDLANVCNYRRRGILFKMFILEYRGSTWNFMYIIISSCTFTSN